MTSKELLTAALCGGQPDHVPFSPNLAYQNLVEHHAGTEELV
jgi:hypothetical protein